MLLLLLISRLSLYLLFPCWRAHGPLLINLVEPCRCYFLTMWKCTISHIGKAKHPFIFLASSLSINHGRTLQICDPCIEHVEDVSLSRFIWMTARLIMQNCIKKVKGLLLFFWKCNFHRFSPYISCYHLNKLHVTITIALEWYTRFVLGSQNRWWICISISLADLIIWCLVCFGGVECFKGCLQLTHLRIEKGEKSFGDEAGVAQIRNRIWYLLMCVQPERSRLLLRYVCGFITSS